MTTLTIPANSAPAPSLNGTADPGPLRAAHTPNFPAPPNFGRNPMRAWTLPNPNQAITFLGRSIHEQFFWFLLATCAAAACVPGPGLWLRGVSFGAVSLWGEKAPLSLPMLLLAFLLFSAELGVPTAQLR